MPIVPFSTAPGQAKAERKPIEFDPAQEPWMLMAAAQMDMQGRLLKMDEELPKIMSDELPKIMNERIERIEADSAGEEQDEDEWGEPDLPTRREGSDLPTRKQR